MKIYVQDKTNREKNLQAPSDRSHIRHFRLQDKGNATKESSK